MRIERGALFYGETRRRKDVELGAALRERTERLAGRMHALVSRGDHSGAGVLAGVRAVLAEGAMPAGHSVRAGTGSGLSTQGHTGGGMKHF